MLILTLNFVCDRDRALAVTNLCIFGDRDRHLLVDCVL